MNWKYGIVSFFAVIFCINAVVVYLAVTTGPDLYEDRPYERGLEYQAEIDLQNSAVARGWSAQYHLKNVGAKRFLEAQVLDANQYFVPGLELALQAKFPADSALDFKLEFEEVAGEAYRSTKPFPFEDERLWFIRLLAKKDQELMIWKSNELL